MGLITILINYIKFLLPFGIYIVWFFLFYFIILGGLRLLNITDVPKSKIRIYVLLMFLLGLLVNPLISTAFREISNKFILYSIDFLISFLIVFLFLKYYFQLSGKKLWQFLLYLISISLIFSLIIFALQYQWTPKEEPELPEAEIPEKTSERLERTIENRIINSMHHIQYIAIVSYKENKDYSKVSCLHPELVSICEDLDLWLGKEPIIHSSSEAYCSYTGLQPGEYYCVDSTGFADKITVNPGQENYCDGKTFTCTREKVEDETVDWKTYRNEEYGFEMNYPKNWEYKDDTKRDCFSSRLCVLAIEVYLPDGQRTDWMEISIFNNTKDLLLEDWLHDFYKKATFRWEEALKEIEIGDNKGLRLTYLPGTVTWQDSIYFSKEEFIYQISLPGYLGAGDFTPPLPKGELYQILSTFRFLE